MDIFPNIDTPKISIPQIAIKNVVPNMDPLKIHVPHSVLILGNGFDLDLGIKTKYE